MDQLEKLWERIRQGRHTAVMGDLPSELPAGCGFYAVRVDCSGPQRALGPLLDARQKVEEHLGGPLPILDQAAERVWTGLRRRLLGEVPETVPGGAIVESLNRLKRQSDAKWALVLECVDAADEDSLYLVREILARPHWLQVPLLLTFSAAQPQGTAGSVLAALLAAEGTDGLVQLEAQSEGVLTPREPLGVHLRGLPSEVLSVLRAGALIGSGFEVGLVGALLGVDGRHVLERLQVAADAGVPLDDNGDGRFDLPDDISQELRASTLPSLAISWHRRLAELLSQTSLDETAAPAEPLTEPGQVERSDGFSPVAAQAAESTAAPEVVPTPPVAAAEAPSVSAPAPVAAVETASPAPSLGTATEPDAPKLHWPYSELLTSRNVPEAADAKEGSGPAVVMGDAPAAEPKPTFPRRRERSEVRARSEVTKDRETERTPVRSDDSGAGYAAAGSDHSSRSRSPIDGRASASSRSSAAVDWSADGSHRKGEASSVGNDARAAGHLVAAGELENGAARFLAAAREAASVGAYVQAVNYGREALGLIESLPVSPRRRRLRITALCELGRVQWQAVGPAGKFTLASALESLTAARQLFEEDDSLELRSTVASLLASVYYDVGDLASLEQALTELTEASRLLLSAGDAVGAARLLNDQAAVYVRLGDSVRASHLLEESRRLFERMASTDVLAAAELAETYHLLARLPLHVAARPGRELDAYKMGRDYAAAAEKAYRQLGVTRELTRVWETMGRLAMRAGHPDLAMQHLTAALSAQRELGDVLGLARTTAALSEVLAAGAQYQDALALLLESIELNLDKGSPIGLAYNRRSLVALGRVLPAGLAKLAGEAHLRLEAAEASLGRIKLPGEPD